MERTGQRCIRKATTSGPTTTGRCAWITNRGEIIWRRPVPGLSKKPGATGYASTSWGASRICLNKKHPHTFARWRHYNELQAQSDAARQVRQAMDAVNRDSVLLTESIGFDVLGQYVDGSLRYDLTEQPSS